MRLSDIIKKILLELSTEIKKEENMIILRSDILNPIIKEIIDEFINKRKTYSSYKEALAASFACKAAVKAGDIMENDEMVMLINRLFSTEHPYYCPHGRPIIFQLSLEELDKRFERI